jgi:hypothetical protein
MAYIRRRETSAGSVSTALVEAYRDNRGRPRQRLLANLHGEPDVLRALVKAVHRFTGLKEFIEQQRVVAASGDYDADLATRYFAKLDAKLKAIEREVEVLSAHCAASDDDIRAAAKEHHQALRDAEAEMLGVRLHKSDAAAKLRRLRR